MEQIQQPPAQVTQAPAPPVPTPPKNIFKDFLEKYKKPLLIGGIAFTALVTVGILIALMGGGKARPSRTPTPRPTQEPTRVEEIKNPSRYATDSAVLKIRSDIEALDKDLNSADLKENFLRPPAIKFDESF